MFPKLGFLLPYSGAFPALKETLLNPFKAFAWQNAVTLVTEYVGNGDSSKVTAALDKLFYNEDADIVIGYVGVRVAVELFDRLRRNPDKIFIHLSLGEVIPYTNSKVDYPPNYCLISYDAWKSEVVLGEWVAKMLAPKHCLICTSQYDAAYSMGDAFRIGYHHHLKSDLTSCVLKNQLKVTDTTGLFNEIKRLRPDHLHVVLCGSELDDFIGRFDQQVDYTPSVSFALPVSVCQYGNISHPSLQNAYTGLPDKTSSNIFNKLEKDAYETIVDYVASKAAYLLGNRQENSDPETISVLEMDFKDQAISVIPFSKAVPAELNGQINYSCENAVSIWQNPYLCI